MVHSFINQKNTYLLCFSLRYSYPSFINCTFVIPSSFKKEEISSYNSRGIIVWKLLFVSLRCSLFFSSYFLRDCLRAVSSFLVTIVFLSLGKFFTIIAKNEQKVNIYTTIPYGTNQSSGYHNHSAPCFSDLAPMRKTFSAITEKRTPKSRFFKFLKILAFLANFLYPEIFLSFLGRSSTCSLIVYPPFKTIMIL